MSASPPFKLRASSLGDYMSCGYRAVLDIVAWEMSNGNPRPREETAIASFGASIHWAIQTALRARFCADADTNIWPSTSFCPVAAAAARPTERLIQAQGVFGENVTELIARSEALSTDAITHLPRVTGWVAELPLLGELFGGHIDLISDDKQIIVDIKTTGKKPPGGRMSPEHFWQLVAYATLVEEVFGVRPRVGHILWVSRDGSFSGLSNPIQYSSPSIDGATDALRSRCAQLTARDFTGLSPTLYGCQFCPHASRCSDALIPPTARMTSAPQLAGVRHHFEQTDPFVGG